MTADPRAERSEDPDGDQDRALFEEYASTRDLALRDQLVTRNLRLALGLARRFSGRGVSTDDLEQVASFALLKAIDRFEPDRGVEFSTFATPTILGELKRHFRDKGWAVRVPRRIQELHLRTNSVVADLSTRLGRPPTLVEVAQAVRASEEDVLEAMDAAQAYRSHALGRADGDGPGPWGADEPGVDDHDLFTAEDRLLVADLLAELPPRERLLVKLRFYDDMTQQEIAERLGISQMHVSRLLKGCMTELRRKLSSNR